MRRQERRDETTLQIGMALLAILSVVVLGALATLTVRATVGLSGQAVDRTFAVSTALAAVVVAAWWLRRRRQA